MTEVLLVDWLGRGGITQTTQAWLEVIRSAGIDVETVSRRSEELEGQHTVSKRLPGAVGAVDAHVRMVKSAIAAVRRLRPSVVYVQNYWLPPLELALVRSARQVGARVILAVHNHQPHQLRAGSAVALGRLMRAADQVVAHSSFVATAVEDVYGCSATVIPLPVMTGLVSTPPVPMPELAAMFAAGRPVAVRFGVLGRSYKGDGLRRMASATDDDWVFVEAGQGASSESPRVHTVDRFLGEGELRWLIEASTASLLPYRSATQSAAVVLAQVLGAPPVASAVGGIPEQISDEHTGLLLAADAPPEAWADSLRRIAADPQWWDGVQAQATEHAWKMHREAGSMILELLGHQGGNA